MRNNKPENMSRFPWVSVWIFGSLFVFFLLSSVLPFKITSKFIDPLIYIITLGPIGFFIVSKIREWKMKNDLMETGETASAKILRVSKTGNSINDNYELEFLLEISSKNDEIFISKAKETISNLELQKWQPGEIVTVRFDPQDTSRVMIVGLGIHNVRNARQANQELNEVQQINDTIQKRGIQANAIVLEFKPWGVNVNGKNPSVTIKVKVIPEDGAPFDSEAHCIIQENSVHKYQPGKELCVRYIPNDYSRVCVDSFIHGEQSQGMLSLAKDIGGELSQHIDKNGYVSIHKE